LTELHAEKLTKLLTSAKHRGFKTATCRIWKDVVRFTLHLTPRVIETDQNYVIPCIEHDYKYVRLQTFTFYNFPSN